MKKLEFAKFLKIKKSGDFAPAQYKGTPLRP